VRPWGRRRAVPTFRALPVETFPAFSGVAVAVTWLGFSRGGYYATAWGPATAIAAGAACTVLACGGGRRLGRGDWAFLGLLAAFVIWIAAGALRPGAATRGMPEVERGALYVATVWALLVALRRSDAAAAALAGAFAGTVALVGAGLLALLLPRHVSADAYEGRLLFEPVGYANACGILAALGCVLALGAVVHAASPVLRAVAAGALAPLVAGLYLSGSRGAVAAAVAGLAAALALDPGRRRLATGLLVAAPLPLLGAWLAERSRVGDVQAPSELILRNGRIVVVAVVLLGIAQASVVPRALERLARGAGRLATPALLLAAAAAGGAAAAVHGAGGALGDRPAYWHVALADVHAHPWLGSGPGTFAVRWLMARTTPGAVQNAHSLYLETLAELGPVGLALLLAALAVPIVCAVRRRSPVSAIACGAYMTGLLHAGLDWDWQMPVVMVTTLVCGAAVVVDARRAGSVRPRTRLILAAAAALLMLAASLETAGNSALASAAQGGPAPAAAALAAERWQPWSAEPQQLLGQAYLAAGDRARARVAYERAARREPDAWETWYELAWLGRPPEREAAIERIVRLNPLAIRPQEQR
jgi:tetratricopeptide (TPR) repeat protein